MEAVSLGNISIIALPLKMTPTTDHPPYISVSRTTNLLAIAFGLFLPSASFFASFAERSRTLLLAIPAAGVKVSDAEAAALTLGRGCPFCPSFSGLATGSPCVPCSLRFLLIERMSPADKVWDELLA